eukprot:4686601-Alexandrium_andersonii.AAC.1
MAAAPELLLQGSPTSAHNERGTMMFRPAGLLGAAAFSTWNLGPVSSLANELFRAVVVLT